MSLLKFEVAEQRGNELVLKTENAGYVKIAELIGNSVHVCIDDVEYFDNVDQCDAAYRDVTRFEAIWNIIKEIVKEGINEGGMRL